MNQLMSTAGERLNLKMHGVGPGGATQICGPADIEGTYGGTKLQANGGCSSGHLGKDGLYYVVDTARLYPPEAPRAFLNAVLISADSQVRFRIFYCSQ